MAAVVGSLIHSMDAFPSQQQPRAHCPRCMLDWEMPGPFAGLCPECAGQVDIVEPEDAALQAALFASFVEEQLRQEAQAVARAEGSTSSASQVPPMATAALRTCVSRSHSMDAYPSRQPRAHCPRCKLDGEMPGPVEGPECAGQVDIVEPDAEVQAALFACLVEEQRWQEAQAVAPSAGSSSSASQAPPTAAAATRTCTSCGASLQPNHQFCGMCGAKALR